MHSQKTYLLFIILLFFSCEGPMFNVPDDVDSIPPTLTLTYPAEQAVLSDTVLISAYAFDNNELEAVSIYLNDSVVHISKDGPYEYSWNTLNSTEDEFHTIRAKAKDVEGNENYTNTIQVLVDNEDNIDPTGTLLFPYTGQTLMGSINITIEANDNESTPLVTIYINGDSIISIAEPPYTYTWDTNEEVDDIMHVIHAHVSDGVGNQITLGPINVTVDNEEAEDYIAPTGNIINPASASTVSGVVNIEVSAFDNVAMSQVDFIINGSIEAQVTSPSNPDEPYTYGWDTENENIEEDAYHIINVNLHDEAGNTTALYPVTVYVNNIQDLDITPPLVTILSPGSGSIVAGSVDFILDAWDDTWPLDRVELYHDYVLEGEATLNSATLRYEYEWISNSSNEDTEHIWYAIAYDQSGNETQSSPVMVFLDNDDNVSPTGYFLYPYPGQTVDSTISIQVSATDNHRVQQVVFNVNGESLGNVSQSVGSVYTYEWNTLVNGLEDQENIIHATIIDSTGNTYVIPSIMVYVNNDDAPENDNIPPFASILTPLSGQTVNDTLTITGFAIDNDSVQDVEFFVNETLISTLTDTPYITYWNTNSLPNGSEHVIQMTATDPTGNQFSAQPVLVTILNEPAEPPVLSLNISGTTATVSWTSVNEATAYRLYKDGSFEIETENLTHSLDIGSGVNTCFVVTSINTQGLESESSNEECGEGSAS